jgi:AraC-like DNA-binding protein
MTALLDAVRRHAEVHADTHGVAPTPIRGLTTVRATAPSGLVYAISRPLVCLMLQGGKHVAMGTRSFAVSAGDSLLIAADVPTVSRITQASLGAPYLSLVLDLDAAVISELAVEMKAVRVDDNAALRIDQTDVEVADVALRLMRLLDHPASVPVLQAQLVREMHYWLLAGRHGTAIRHLGWRDSHVQRVARAVSLLRSQFAQPLPVARLAAVAGMSPSSFHEHFRAITSLSPRQFQKQLRLIEARRLMLSDGVSAHRAACAVGYESVQQFTRDYGRMFGCPPVRDIGAGKRVAQAAA